MLGLMQKKTQTLSTLALLSLLTLTACGANQTPSSNSPSASSSTSAEASSIQEATSPNSRIALTYDGGIMILDGKTFQVIETLKADGFLRLNDAGDNRHLVVSNGSSYTFLDTGAWAQGHDDHNHYYTSTPSLTSLSLAAKGTGHVIPGAGKVALFADKSGSFQIYNPAQLTGDSQLTTDQLDTQTITLASPHHGLAIPLEDNKYLVSLGTEEGRTGAAVIDAEGKILTQNNDCPGVHGEAQAANHTYTIGCQDGALIYQDGTFTKVSNPEDPYSRSGNQAGDPNSHMVLADYKTDKEAELERPEQFALINTISKERSKIQLPEGVSYSFRSLARGPQGSHLLLTTDGKLRFWAEDGNELGAVDVTAPWTESTIWQDPRPAIWVDGDTAYVTDPASKKLHVVSLAKMADGQAEVFASVDLPEVPNEIKGISRTSKLVTESEASHGH